jgi:acyl carrier protein
MTNRERFTRELVAWLNARLAPPGVEITATTPLFSSGIVNSIKILELIAWTERATNAVVPDARIRLDNFATAARVAEVFVAEETDVAA